jgi:hypothetical protein
MRQRRRARLPRRRRSRPHQARPLLPLRYERAHCFACSTQRPSTVVSLRCTECHDVVDRKLGSAAYSTLCRCCIRSRLRICSTSLCLKKYLSQSSQRPSPKPLPSASSSSPPPPPAAATAQPLSSASQPPSSASLSSSPAPPPPPTQVRLRHVDAAFEMMRASDDDDDAVVAGDIVGRRAAAARSRIVIRMRCYLCACLCTVCATGRTSVTTVAASAVVDIDVIICCISDGTVTCFAYVSSTPQYVCLQPSSVLGGAAVRYTQRFVAVMYLTKIVNRSRPRCYPRCRRKPHHRQSQRMRRRRRRRRSPLEIERKAASACHLRLRHRPRRRRRRCRHRRHPRHRRRRRRRHRFRRRRARCRRPDRRAKPHRLLALRSPVCVLCGGHFDRSVISRRTGAASAARCFFGTQDAQQRACRLRRRRTQLASLSRVVSLVDSQRCSRLNKAQQHRR